MTLSFDSSGYWFRLFSVSYGVNGNNGLNLVKTAIRISCCLNFLTQIVFRDKMKI